MNAIEGAYVVGYLAGLVVALAIVYLAVSVAKIWIEAHRFKHGNGKRKSDQVRKGQHH